METEVAGMIGKADKKLYILCSCSPLQRSCNEKKIFASTDAVFTNVWWGTIESISLFGLTLVSVARQMAGEGNSTRVPDDQRGIARSDKPRQPVIRS